MPLESPNLNGHNLCEKYLPYLASNWLTVWFVLNDIQREDMAEWIEDWAQWHSGLY